MGSYKYRKVEIEGVGCFTVPAPVWDLLQDIDTVRDNAISERDALREEVALLNAAIESDAENRIEAHDAANQARAFAADLREELAVLRAIAQNALDHGGDRELVYAPLYHQALEDIASEPQEE